MDSETSVRGGQDAATHAAREVIELLEVLWSRGRDIAPTAPVSSSQLRVLYVLDGAQGINLRTLGECLGSAPSSVSRMCDRLHALGFIERSLSSASRRELELRLSSRGENYLNELRARRESALLDAISAMRPAERSALVRGLSGFQRAVDGTVPGRPPAREGTAESA
ncbi:MULTISPECIES: MarR family winged helix-turn-helix transcriptional regulator [unclassified Streptomyces]|uniref:MarR family winged helix-turn-helix transcriptional regulator n=1 Tax=unclassified Streptomyces TaxID=2593676 RepID=UPI002285B779|nr:MarR family transcriptional regulator [Streptomyces sp. Je 1-369]WAL98806.1 MarR family transcriptional regulator [Streptomyces sp. Je 1-369]